MIRRLALAIGALAVLAVSCEIAAAMPTHQPTPAAPMPLNDTQTPYNGHKTTNTDKTMPTDEISQNKAIVTGCDYLTIRVAAGEKNTAINYIPSGGIVDIMGVCDPGGWVEISWGVWHGWVNADYLNYGSLCK